LGRKEIEVRKRLGEKASPEEWLCIHHFGGKSIWGWGHPKMTKASKTSGGRMAKVKKTGEAARVAEGKGNRHRSGG